MPPKKRSALAPDAPLSPPPANRRRLENEASSEPTVSGYAWAKQKIKQFEAEIEAEMEAENLATLQTKKSESKKTKAKNKHSGSKKKTEPDSKRKSSSSSKNVKALTSKAKHIQISSGGKMEMTLVPLEEDNTVLLSTLKSFFPRAFGLRYRNENGGRMHYLLPTDGKLQAPNEGWSIVSKYNCSYSRVSMRSENEIKGTRRVQDKACRTLFPVLYAAHKAVNLEESKQTPLSALKQQYKLYYPSDPPPKNAPKLHTFRVTFSYLFGKNKLHLLPPGDLCEPLSSDAKCPLPYEPTKAFLDYNALMNSGNYKKRKNIKRSAQVNSLWKQPQPPYTEADYVLAFKVVGLDEYCKNRRTKMETTCCEYFAPLYATYKTIYLDGSKQNAQAVLKQHYKLYYLSGPLPKDAPKFTTIRTKWSLLFSKNKLPQLPPGDLCEPLPSDAKYPLPYVPTKAFIDYYVLQFQYYGSVLDPTKNDDSRLDSNQRKCMSSWGRTCLADLGLSEFDALPTSWKDNEFSAEEKEAVLPFLEHDQVRLHEDYGYYCKIKDFAIKIVKSMNIPTSADDQNGQGYHFGVAPKSHGTYSRSNSRVYFGVAKFSHWDLRLYEHKHEIESANSSSTEKGGDTNIKYNYFTKEVANGTDIYHSPCLRCIPRLSLSCLFFVEFLFISYLKQFPWCMNIQKGNTSRFDSTLGASIPPHIARLLGCALFLYTFERDLIPETDLFVPGKKM